MRVGDVMTTKTKDKKNETKNVDVKKTEVKSKKPDVKTTSTPTQKDAKAANDIKKDTKNTKPKSFDKVEHGHFVAVEYTGTLDDGEVFDTSAGNGPIKFVVGGAQVIKGFDTAVLGMKLNEQKKVNIPKHEAYGDVNPELTKEFPLSAIPKDIKSQLKVGGFLVLQTPYGQQVPTKVIAMDKEKVKIDMNHPLAGKNLTFQLKVVEITEAPENMCGCGDGEGSCSDGCCDDKEDKDDSCGCGHEHH